MKILMQAISKVHVWCIWSTGHRFPTTDLLLNVSEAGSLVEINLLCMGQVG